MQKEVFSGTPARCRDTAVHTIRLTGERATFEMLRGDISFFLIGAKAEGWPGGDDLFTRPRDE